MQDEEECRIPDLRGLLSQNELCKAKLWIDVKKAGGLLEAVR